MDLIFERKIESRINIVSTESSYILVVGPSIYACWLFFFVEISKK